MNVNYPKKGNIVLEDAWDILKASTDDEFFLVRMRRGTEALIGHPEYSHVLQVAIFLKTDRRPSEAEIAEVDAIEGQLSAGLEFGHQSLLVLVATSFKMRELVFYTTSPEDSKKTLQGLRSRITSHQISSTSQSDPAWKLFKKFSIRESEN